MSEAETFIRFNCQSRPGATSTIPGFIVKHLVRVARYPDSSALIYARHFLRYTCQVCQKEETHVLSDDSETIKAINAAVPYTEVLQDVADGVKDLSGAGNLYSSLEPFPPMTQPPLVQSN